MEELMDRPVLSIDIGGTNTKFGLVDRVKGILGKSHMDTSKFNNKNDFADALHQQVNILCDELSYDQHLAGIGVGVPGINSNNGLITQIANIPFLKNVDLVSLLTVKFDTPVQLSKDSNIAALGEGAFGAAMGMKNYIVLTLGTGLGCAVVIDGKILKSTTGLTGEFGHAIVEKNGRECGCGRFGCLETYVSGSGLIRTVVELLSHKKGKSILRNFSFNDLNSKLIFEAAKKNDKIALEAFKLTGSILGENIANLITLLDPEAIILAGGLGEAKEFLQSAITEKIKSNCLYYLNNNTKIVFSSLGINDAALFGAAALIWNDKKEIAI